ncbi:MAG: hypothetical protein ACREDC_04045 [Bradyrhizobium sp.]
MTDKITVWILSALGYLCTAPATAGGHHHLAGPLLGNVLVAAVAALVTLASMVVALRMLIDPGESDPNHPKYRVLDADR